LAEEVAESLAAFINARSPEIIGKDTALFDSLLSAWVPLRSDNGTILLDPIPDMADEETGNVWLTVLVSFLIIGICCGAGAVAFWVWHRKAKQRERLMAIVPEPHKVASNNFFPQATTASSAVVTALGRAFSKHDTSAMRNLIHWLLRPVRSSAAGSASVAPIVNITFPSNTSAIVSTSPGACKEACGSQATSACIPQAPSSSDASEDETCKQTSADYEQIVKAASDAEQDEISIENSESDLVEEIIEEFFEDDIAQVLRLGPDEIQEDTACDTSDSVAQVMEALLVCEELQVEEAEEISLEVEPLCVPTADSQPAEEHDVCETVEFDPAVEIVAQTSDAQQQFEISGQDLTEVRNVNKRESRALPAQEFKASDKKAGPALRLARPPFLDQSIQVPQKEAVVRESQAPAEIQQENHQTSTVDLMLEATIEG
jgi:hypothetical protein